MTRNLPRTLKAEWLDWYRSFLSAVPGELGCRARNRFYGFQAQPGCRVLRGVVVYFPDRLVLGRNVGISCYTQLNAAGGIEIGDGSLVGPGCTIWSVNHRFQDPQVPILSQGYDSQKIVIGPDCWIAANAVVLAGVHLGAGSVVAAGAVVTHSCEAGSILAGVPARTVGMRGKSRPQA